MLIYFYIFDLKISNSFQTSVENFVLKNAKYFQAVSCSRIYSISKTVFFKTRYFLSIECSLYADFDFTLQRLYVRFAVLLLTNIEHTFSVYVRAHFLFFY